jgi:hypothetical protein
VPGQDRERVDEVDARGEAAQGGQGHARRLHVESRDAKGRNDAQEVDGPLPARV